MTTTETPLHIEPAATHVLLKMYLLVLALMVFVPVFVVLTGGTTTKALFWVGHSTFVLGLAWAMGPQRYEILRDRVRVVARFRYPDIPFATISRVKLPSRSNWVMRLVTGSKEPKNSVTLERQNLPLMQRIPFAWTGTTLMPQDAERFMTALNAAIAASRASPER